MIPFNKPHLTGKESEYVNDAIQSGKIAGDGKYTKICEAFFEKRYGFLKTFLTTSCTHAIELAALLIDIKAGDEVIIPSYTFVSSANPFILRGAKIVFADSSPTSPNIDINLVEGLITPATKAILTVHYGGIPCEVDKLRAIADKHKVFLIVDAAQTMDSFYKGKPVGSFGHLSAFSFHETKNITCGEGGLLIINDKQFVKRAEVLREKGTNRSSFIRGEINRYQWVDTGSSYAPSDILAAYLLAQLESIDTIQQRRLNIWQQYYQAFINLQHQKLVTLPFIPNGVIHNAHTFYFVLPSLNIRQKFITFMSQNGVQVQFHYIPLHDSPFYKKHHDNRKLPMANKYKNCLVRLPLFYDMTEDEVKTVIRLSLQFFQQVI
ncbi:MAG: dTDP-4-amino-4,6-dideoxygalactose transaminase [Bacteroidota bacterium]